MNLPGQFIGRMQKKLGNAFPDFLRTYGRPPEKGVRVNTLKISRGEFLRLAPVSTDGAVPWEENGFYTAAEKPGATIAHAAGLYYCQEPSAMCAVPLLGVQPGERVLDLCAAPGGKTTQLASALRGEGLLIANEYVYSRAGVLSQNVERMGIKNCAVTSASPAALSAAFGASFDKVLVDAPCSGEGMFKKEPNAIPEWSEENVSRCAARQAEILESAASLLVPGGRMVYSTCTFSEEENEGQIARFLRAHPEFRLLRQERLYPHEVRGEGHFAALLEKDEGEGMSMPMRPLAPVSAAARRAAEAFAEEFFAAPLSGVLAAAHGDPDRLYLVPEGMGALPVPVLRCGVELGRLEKGIFRPAHALAMACTGGQARRFVELDDGAAAKFLRGETAASWLEDGWCLVGWHGYPLGLGKIVGGVVKNHYPKGLRR